MADEPISGLPAVSSPNSTDLVPIEHGPSGGPYATSATTIAELVTAAGVSGGVTELNTKTGAVTLTSPDSSVSIGSSGDAITLEVAGGGGGGGVTEINTKTGAVTITSPDSSVSIGSSGDAITLEVSGGGGGGGGGGGTADASAYSSLIMASSPYAYYRFQELTGTVMADSSGNGRTGTYYNNVGLGSPSLTHDADDYALQLYDNTGTWSGGVLPFNPDGWSAFSFECIITPVSSQSGSGQTATTGRIVSDGLLGVYGSFEVFVAANSVGDLSSIGVNVSGTNGYNTWYSPPLLIPGKANHVCVTYDGQWHVYINGILRYNTTFGTTGGSLSTGSAHLFIGNQAGGGAPTAPNGQQDQGTQYLGVVDEMAFYTTALSASDVLARAQALRITVAGGSPGSAYDSLILSQSPTHYWPLNDVAGSSEAADLVGSQPLTPSGSPAFGAAPLALDGETSVWSSGSADSLTMSEACQPTGNFSISFLCSIAALTGATAWSFGNSNGNFGIGVYNTGSPYVFALLSNLINWYYTNVAVSASKVHVCVTYNAGTFLVYINGALALDSGSITCTPSTTTGSISGVPGRMAKAALWVGTVLTLQQVLAQVAAAGL
jgi:hypothetical protein